MVPAGHRSPIAGNRTFIVEIQKAMIGQGSASHLHARLRRLGQRPGLEHFAHFEHEVEMDSLRAVVVGWVERSEPHRRAMVGLAALDPPYCSVVTEDDESRHWGSHALTRLWGGSSTATPTNRTSPRRHGGHRGLNRYCSPCPPCLCGEFIFDYVAPALGDSPRHFFHGISK